MRSTVLAVALVSTIAVAAHAQRPAAPPAGPGAPGAAAMLLAHTGGLQLSDAQVVRLAAIARRGQSRREAMRAAGDSAHRAMMNGAAAPAARDSARHRMGPMMGMPGMAAMQAAMERERAASHADLRDALAVLTDEQRATAFEQMARGGRAREARRGAMRERGGMRPMPGADRRPSQE